jgi:hypothetical protein
MKPLKKIHLSESMIELSDNEMKMTVRGSGGDDDGSGSGSGEGGNPTCYWKCTCDTAHPNGLYLVTFYAGDCYAGGPWDRNEECPNGLQDCFQIS